MRYCIRLPHYVLDKNAGTDYDYPLFDNPDNTALFERPEYEPKWPTIRVTPWAIIRKPEFIEYMAKRYDALNLGEFGVVEFLSDTIWTADANLLTPSEGLIDVERCLPDHMLMQYANRQGELEKNWYRDFLKFSHMPPKQHAQIRMKGRYSCFALGLLIYDLKPKLAW